MLQNFGPISVTTWSHRPEEKLPSGLPAQQLQEFQRSQPHEQSLCSLSLPGDGDRRCARRLNGDCVSCDRAVFSRQKRGHIPERSERSDACVAPASGIGTVTHSQRLFCDTGN